MQRWYVVHSKPRQESVAEEHLGRQAFEVWLPKAAVTRRLRGHWVERIEPLFPRYLFLKADVEAVDISPVRSTRGCAGLVRVAGMPAVVPDAVIAWLKANADADSGLHQLGRTVSARLRVGEKVRVLEGPCHFPEKLVPLMILNALEGKALPVYGAGDQVRDWLYVEDHARALLRVLAAGVPGETYAIGGHIELRNIDVVHAICDLLQELSPPGANGQGDAVAERFHYRDLVTHVQDRPGHDLRYAIDAGKIERELGWTPAETFESGLRKTVHWYLGNQDWCRRVQDGSYRRERLGVAPC